MNIAIIVRVLWPGGVQKVAIEEARWLRRFGHNVKLIFLRRSKLYERNIYQLEDWEYDVAMKGDQKNLLRSLFRLVTMIYASNRGPDATIDLDLIVKEPLKLKGFDAVIYHDQFAGIGGLVKKTISGEEYYVFIHESNIAKMKFWPISLKFKYLLPYLIEKKVIKEAKYVFTNSRKNAEGLRKVNPNVEVLYQGCYPLDKLPKNRENIVLAAALWESGRRPEIYLEIAKNLKHGKIVIAGSWINPAEMTSFINKVKKENVENLIVTGPISEGELRSLYLKSKVFMRFGFYLGGEFGLGQGNVDALGYGLPVISNNLLGISEVVEDGVHGYIFEEIDSKEVAEKIDELLLNENKYKEMSRNAWELGKKLSWENHARKLSEILLEYQNLTPK